MSNLVFWVLHRDVTVEVNSVRIQGCLVGIQEGSRGLNHTPTVLALLNRLGQTILIRNWTLIAFEETKIPTPTGNATPSHSLHSTDASHEKFLDRKAVANNVVKLSFGGYGENPLNCHVENMRSMGVMENGKF